MSILNNLSRKITRNILKIIKIDSRRDRQKPYKRVWISKLKKIMKRSRGPDDITSEIYQIIKDS